MENKLYVVYDSKSESYSGPHSHRTKGEAIRTFTDACNDPETMLYKHPEDYTLMEVGGFNLTTGIITAYDAKVPVGSALEFKKQLTLDASQEVMKLAK